MTAVTDPPVAGKPVAGKLATGQKGSLVSPHILWPGIVVGLLTLSVTICLTTIVLATGDASVSIEPAYYERALAWDDRKREQAASDALGWMCDLRIAEESGAGRDRTIALTIEDSDGPVSGATVSLEAFANARASRRLQLDARMTGEGEYRARLAAPQAGLWTFSIRARRGEDVLTVTRRVSIEPAEGGR